jgi:hypothetical protein
MFIGNFSYIYVTPKYADGDVEFIKSRRRYSMVIISINLAAMKSSMILKKRKIVVKKTKTIKRL